MTTQFLLALILVGVLPHPSFGTEKGRTPSSESEVKYRGPVVYTNLPPPVLYFPKFPERPPASLLSKRGDSATEESKRVEYVPYPYKDLPLLVYQSESQPPVHVVQKGTTEADEPYQSSPAMYRTQTADEQKFINVGLTTSSAPPVDPSNPQYISIGLTAVQPQQSSDTVTQASQQQAAPSIVYFHPSALSSPTAYSSSSSGSDSQPQATIPVEQLTQLIQNYLLQQSGIHQAITSYPSGRQPEATSYEPVSDTTTGQHVGITIIRQPDGAQLLPRHPQQQQSYEEDVQPQQYVSIGVYPFGGGEYGTDQQHYYNLVADPYPNPNEDYRQTTNEDYQNQKETSSYQPMNSDYRQTRPSYQMGGDNYRPVKQHSYQSVQEDYRNSKEPPYHHQGSPTNDDYRNPKEPPYHHQGSPMNDDYRNPKEPPYNHQGSPMNDDYRNPKEPPYHHQVSPMNDDYRQAKPSYPDTANENYRKQPYQNMNEDYRNSKYHGPEKPGTNDNPQTTGYQVISIDLSALRNQQNAGEHQQRNVNPTYSQPPPEQPVAPPPQNYRHPNEKEALHGGREKEFQQILIQIPHKILSEPEKPMQHARGPNETPYTGTAQVANVVGNNAAPARRPLPPPQADKARHPKEVHHMPPPGGLLPNGINIAIIKQTDSTSNAPIYKSPSGPRPQYHPPMIRNPSQPRPNVHHRPAPPREHPRHYFGQPNKPQFSQQNHNFRPNAGREVPVVARTPYPIPVMSYNHHQQQHRIRPTKPRLPNFVGHPHPGIFASSNLHFTTITPDGSKPQPIFGIPPKKLPFLQQQPAKDPGTFVNNIPNGPFGGDINFDEINAFLNPSYDLFGSMTNGPDKKKVEEETKFLQKVTSDLLTQELNAAAAAPPANVPFPYKYWEQPPVIGPPGGGVTTLQNFYSHLQHPHIRGKKRFPTIGKGSGRKRGLGKGLRKKLSALRSSIRGKSKIAPRLEEDMEDVNVESSVPKIASLIAGTKAFGNISPRQTGLDGITIPLNPDHVLSSRISTDEDVKTDQSMPPIIVYKGFKPPVEVYGSKDDIEKTSNEENRTVTNDKETASTESPVVQTESQKSAEKGAGDETAGYTDYMYSLLPDLIRSSLNRRLDGDKWLPVGPVEYALAEDSYDRNETTTTTTPTPKVPVEVSSSSSVSLQYSSSKVQESIKENIEELFSLLGKEEKSDLDKE